jgi:hypothetical protein
MVIDVDSEDQVSCVFELLAIANSRKMVVEWQKVELVILRRVTRSAKIHFGILENLSSTLKHQHYKRYYPILRDLPYGMKLG